MLIVIIPEQRYGQPAEHHSTQPLQYMLGKIVSFQLRLRSEYLHFHYNYHRYVVAIKNDCCHVSLAIISDQKSRRYSELSNLCWKLLLKFSQYF